MEKKMLKQKYPIVYENSKIPEIVGYLAPIKPFAISFFLFVFCSKKIPERTLRHETIHYYQQKELYFVGQWLLYAFYHIKGCFKYKDGAIAYRMNPFEREAFDKDTDINYLQARHKFAWKEYRD
jgi:hypothetical protein